MRIWPAAILVLTLTGCMSRSGMIDCTTNRAYPGFSKPLCGGPCDPFMWLAGDCATCCCGTLDGAFTPYGGRTCCGDPMTYTPSCVSPPLQWAPPAIPVPPSGHTVHLPSGTVATPPRTAPAESAPPLPPAPEPPAEEPVPSALDVPPADDLAPGAFLAPRILNDARLERGDRARM